MGGIRPESEAGGGWAAKGWDDGTYIPARAGIGWHLLEFRSLGVDPSSLCFDATREFKSCSGFARLWAGQVGAASHCERGAGRMQRDARRVYLLCRSCLSSLFMPFRLARISDLPFSFSRRGMLTRRESEGQIKNLVSKFWSRLSSFFYSTFLANQITQRIENN